ncbi:hypothetical protein M3221_22835 [Domibacillus indicus]|uniref:hypothetical protein n=1 Tax=Domibacillus indicus TaxID=1437523 RepID=UPI00203E6A0F|nr:hypothetical protein [Domibacillus indicus]MCM3791175.1 hypothetical protein [Domibacillus indicus]
MRNKRDEKEKQDENPLAEESEIAVLKNKNTKEEPEILKENMEEREHAENEEDVRTEDEEKDEEEIREINDEDDEFFEELINLIY